MEIHFAFGRDGLALTLPDGPRYEVIESRSASALPDVAARHVRSLRGHPAGVFAGRLYREERWARRAGD